jgi:predicted N-acetyltransferase YhbS
MPLHEASHDAVEQLLDDAFGRDRHGRTAYRLRIGAEPDAALSFAAFEGEALVGTLQSWPIALVGAARWRWRPAARAPASAGR